MSWLESLKQRWLRGGNSTVAKSDDQVERDVYTSPDEASQLSTLPDEQQDDLLGRSSRSDSP